MSDSDVSNNSGDEIESPADGPMPDWMKSAAASGDSSSMDEGNVPDWLQTIRSGDTVDADSATPAATAASGTSEASSADDEMSDLERLLAEEGIDLLFKGNFLLLIPIG